MALSPSLFLAVYLAKSVFLVPVENA